MSKAIALISEISLRVLQMLDGNYYQLVTLGHSHTCIIEIEIFIHKENLIKITKTSSTTTSRIK